MLPRLAFGLAYLAALPVLALGGCSSKLPRDQNYGTDAGVGYQPEAATISSQGQPEASAVDVPLQDAPDAQSAGEVGADADF